MSEAFTCFQPAPQRFKQHVQLFGSGSIMPSVLKAQAMLAGQFQVSADVWSATSYQQLRDEALCADRYNRLHPEAAPRLSYVVQMLDGIQGPIIAATDYMKMVPDMIRPWVKQRFVALGTDGFGRSDTREALRRHFEVDAENICVATLYALCQEGTIPASEVSRAIRVLGLDPDKLDPLHPQITRRQASQLEVEVRAQ